MSVLCLDEQGGFYNFARIELEGCET